MANGLSKTKRRISSIESTEKTTKAMGLIAMVKLRRLTASFASQSFYCSQYRDLISHLAFYAKESDSPYLKVNEEAKGTLYLLLTSDLGLCGAYNTSLFKVAEKTLKEKDTLAPFGKKGLNHFAAINYRNLDLSWAEGGSLLEDEYRRELAKRIMTEFQAGKYQRICVISTHYVNSLRAEPRIRQLLPLQLEFEPWEDEKASPPEFDSSPQEMLEALLPTYLFGELTNLFTESSLSEQSTRRNAMDAANDNADELLEKLRIEYNKARQSAITQEITEVVGGSLVDE